MKREAFPVLQLLRYLHVCHCSLFFLAFCYASIQDWLVGIQHAPFTWTVHTTADICLSLSFHCNSASRFRELLLLKVNVAVERHFTLWLNFAIDPRFTCVPNRGDRGSTTVCYTANAHTQTLTHTHTNTDKHTPTLTHTHTTRHTQTHTYIHTHQATQAIRHLL
jgi:hypothetical protein